MELHKGQGWRWFRAGEGEEPWAEQVMPKGSVPSGLFSQIFQLRERFPTLHPNKMKSALTLQNVDEFFRVNQPCQSDVELSPTCDII